MVNDICMAHFQRDKSPNSCFCLNNINKKLDGNVKTTHFFYFLLEFLQLTFVLYHRHWKTVAKHPTTPFLCLDLHAHTQKQKCLHTLHTIPSTWSPFTYNGKEYKYFTTSNSQIYKDTDLNVWFDDKILKPILTELEEFPNLKSQFSNISNDQLQLLTKKGVMPYDYIDSFERFDETQLPPIESFYSKLYDKPCPRRHYLHAKLVWSKFGCKDLGQYVDLYMKTDIMLLADVFEQFRSSCHNTYGLDPAHYFTLPGFTWDAMLKHTKQELELLTDVDMFLFVEQGIRGGLSQVCSKRRAQANNKYMPNYNSSKPDSYLMYYDVNNQYGWAMSQSLPYGGFEWADTNIDVTAIPDDADKGCILEVDLEYPHRLHNLHKDIPFCPEHINPKTMKPPTRSSQPTKLMATLNHKEKYVIHYRTLKQALKHGLVLKKIHRVLKFRQSPWLKSYIDLNTNLRKQAKNEFEKNLFKLMNNAVFGKTMENIRKRVNVRLLTEWAGRYGAESYISKPEFKNCIIFNENLVAVELGKLEIWLNKPIYVGIFTLTILPILFPAVTFKSKKPANHWKPSKIEVKNGFILHVKEFSDLENELTILAQRYETFGLTAQPIPVIVGENLNGSEYFVCVGNLKYKVDIVLKAVDLCFKIYFATNTQYPKECEAASIFIQWYLFDIKTSFDKSSINDSLDDRLSKKIEKLPVLPVTSDYSSNQTEEVYISNVNQHVDNRIDLKNIQNLVFSDLRVFLSKLYNNSLLTHFGTEYERFKFFRDSGEFIPPLDYKIGNRNNHVADKAQNRPMQRLISKPVIGKIIPSREVFKVFFEKPGVYANIQNNCKQILDSKTSVDFIQDELWKTKSSSYLESGKIVYPLFLYFDDYQAGNPLGSHSDKNKLGAVYVKIPCFPEELLSSLNNLFLFALFHSSDRKKYGNKAVFKDVISELNFLQETGIEIVVNSMKIQTYFKFGSIIGDDLGIHSMLGLTESFSANYTCRMCKVHKRQLKICTSLPGNLLRTVDSYNDDLSKNDVSLTGIKT
ncbi:unnamed protein product [Phaedon cochleariae]|uniref:DNA-directed DNA polymerase n=1 Tax=Phaedon cochleariae TaxID=80249 RepID=A0A9P0DWG9_PHACE|nr:unnamed protein product [Phaedon cochleariae]